MIAAILLAATLAENVAAVTNAAAQIDAAIVAKGGTTAGGLTNAAAAIRALPSGEETVYAVTNGIPVYDYEIVDLLSTPKSNTDTKLNGIKDFFSDKIECIAQYSFCGSAKACTNFVAPNVKYIGGAALYGNPNLESVYLPNVRDLSNSGYLFESCPKLREVDFSNYYTNTQFTAISITSQMFWGTTGSVGYGNLKVYFTNCTYTTSSPFDQLPFGRSGTAITNAWFYFQDGIVVKYIDGAWSPTQEN